MVATTIAYSGAPVTYTVPAGCTAVTIECWGARGFGGGLGGYSKGDLVAASGTVLNVFVGGQSVDWPGGWNGGGDGSSYGGGGGGSDVRLGGTALSNRVIVAGAGGGGAGAGVGGGASGSTGSNGGDGTGIGGTQTTGYALGQGGAGAGGGGGGGYWGGTAGSNGGGGGSGYVGTLSSPSMSNGVRTGNGQVVITPVVNVAPLAPTLNTPATNGYVFASDANLLKWTPNHPTPGDWQTRADLRWRVGAAGWTTVPNVATTVAQYLLPAAAWTAGTVVEWQISTFGAFGLQSPFSASSFVNVIAALAAPTITSPAQGSNQYSTPVTLSWTETPAGDAYQVVRSSATGATGTVYYDSGTVASGALSASVPLDATAGRTDFLSVRFRYAGHWSPYASVSISNQFGPPKVPLLVCTPYPKTASVTVQITNPAAGSGYATTVSNDLDRTSPDGSTVPIAKGLPPNATVTDWIPGAGVNQYRVTSYAASGSTATSY